MTGRDTACSSAAPGPALPSHRRASVSGLTTAAANPAQEFAGTPSRLHTHTHTHLGPNARTSHRTAMRSLLCCVAVPAADHFSSVGGDDDASSAMAMGRPPGSPAAVRPCSGPGAHQNPKWVADRLAAVPQKPPARPTLAGRMLALARRRRRPSAQDDAAAGAAPAAGKHLMGVAAAGGGGAAAGSPFMAHHRSFSFLSAQESELSASASSQLSAPVGLVLCCSLFVHVLGGGGR